VVIEAINSPCRAVRCREDIETPRLTTEDVDKYIYIRTRRTRPKVENMAPKITRLETKLLHICQIFVLTGHNRIFRDVPKARGSIPGRIIWDLWRTKRNLGCFSLKVFRFPPPTNSIFITHYVIDAVPSRYIGYKFLLGLASTVILGYFNVSRLCIVVKKNKINKKFWEDLVTYFSLIRRLQQFFFAARTCSASRCLATLRRDTYMDTQIDGRNLLSRPMRWARVQ
jgi:hypothetical protein